MLFLQVVNMVKTLTITITDEPPRISTDEAIKGKTTYRRSCTTSEGTEMVFVSKHFLVGTLPKGHTRKVTGLIKGNEILSMY